MSSHPNKGSMEHSRKYPFNNMRIDDHTILDKIEGRHNCQLCSRSRKFFCYNCYIPVGNLAGIIPNVQLPIDIDIIKHKKEIDGKSTAAHASVLAPQNVKIYTYPNILDYRLEDNDKVVLIYPSAESITVHQLFKRNKKKTKERRNQLNLPKGYNRSTLLKSKLQELIYNNDDGDSDEDADYKSEFYKGNLPIQKAVFIDSTWNQSKGIYKDERIKCLKSIVLQNRCSQFWRHQKGSPRWYLATIEAIHQLLVELHINAWGLNADYKGLDNLEIDDNFFNSATVVVNCVNEDTINGIKSKAPYNGQYDNLMYFFANMYDLIHKYYDHNELKSYRRPI